MGGGGVGWVYIAGGRYFKLKSQIVRDAYYITIGVLKIVHKLEGEEVGWVVGEQGKYALTRSCFDVWRILPCKSLSGQWHPSKKIIY